ncbi:MAG: hypothetical protein ACJ8J7_11465 [Sulfurifustaceae bacterium]
MQFTLDTNGFIRSIIGANGHVYAVETQSILIGRVIYTVATQLTDDLGRSQRFS